MTGEREMGRLGGAGGGIGCSDVWNEYCYTDRVFVIDLELARQLTTTFKTELSS